MIAYQRRTVARPGLVIAAVWFIGLGAVFLIRDQFGWSWGEAWPLFIILLGTSSLVSSLAGYRRLSAGTWSLLWSVAWIAIGAVLLLSTTRAIAISPADLIATWWPVALIAMGVWFLIAAVWPGGTRPLENLSLPLAPGAPSAEVRIRFGGGELHVERGTPGMLVSGSFSGGVVHQQTGPNAVQLEPYTGGGWPFMWDRRLDWQVGFTDEVPLDLRVDGGASRATLDLSDLLVRRLELHTGASDTRVTLPNAGGTAVRAEAGAASVTIAVPDGVAARIRARMAVGSVSVNEARFLRSGEGYESADYATNPRRSEIDVQGGVGAVRII